MPGKMVDLNVRETSGVDHPAHMHEGFLVMKAANHNRANVVLSAFGKKESIVTVQSASPEAIKKAIDEALQPVLDMFAEGWKALRDYAEKADPDMPSADGVDPAAQDEMLAQQAQADLMLSSDVLKSAPEAVVKAIEAQRAELVKAREDFAKERDIRLDNEAVQFAKATWGNLGLPEETVKAVRRAEQFDPELAEALKAMLTSANAQLDGASLLKELGTGATVIDPAGTAMEQVDQKAKALFEAKEYDTIQKARVAVYEAHPELVEAVKGESR